MPDCFIETHLNNNFMLGQASGVVANIKQMKKNITLSLVIFCSILVACSQSNNTSDNDSTQTPQISFEDTNYDFGDITYKGNGTHEFEFTNKGNSPLLLSNVRSSCGCTIPTWPKEPFEPGKKGVIVVKYDTKRIGPFNKSITVYSNASNNPVVLRIKGKVLSETTEE